jgi:YVTN family beta-propeller protein
VTKTIGVDPTPQIVLMAPNGNRVYVAHRTKGSVAVIDTGTDSVIARPQSGAGAHLMAITPNSGQLFVANVDTVFVSMINTANNAVDRIIPVGAVPVGIAMAPNGSRVYVSSQGVPGSDTWVLSVIDTFTNTVVGTTRVDPGPGIVAATARNVYVANLGSSTVSVVDV